MLGEYDIHQYLYKNNSHIHNFVAKWRKDTETIELFRENFTWNIYKENIDDEAIADKEDNVKIPKSVCSEPCGRKQFAVVQEVHCCWICRECRNNEIIVNSSSCEICPELYWPDEENAETCIKIGATYMKPTDIIALSLISLNGLLLITTLIFIILFYKNRKKKLVKASGKEFMGIIMMGMCLAYITVFIFVMKPNIIFCYITHFGFNISVTLIYTPLVVKTNRVYRIFAGSEKFVKEFKCISITSQLFITAVIVIIQVRELSFFTGRGVICL